MDSSTSFENEPSTSMRPNRGPESHAQYSGTTSGSPSPTPAHHYWRESDMNESHHSRSDNEYSPPPYELFRRSSTSSGCSAQTVRMGAESEERQDNNSPPPPYELLRRSSTSSGSSAQTVRVGAESEEGQMLLREESDSE